MKNFDPKRGLQLSFFILCVFLAIRYDFGNDYLSYLSHFDAINKLPNSYRELLHYSEDNRLEIGFVYFFYLFPSGGFFFFVIVWSIANCFLYYKWIVRHVVSHWYWLALLIYLFWPGGMLIQASAIRQTMVLFLFMIAFRFIVHRNFYKFTGIILLAGLFHKSAFLLFPFYFLGDPRLSFERLNYFIVSLFILLFLIDISFRQTLLPFINSYFMGYSHYLSDEWSAKIVQPSIFQQIFMATGVLFASIVVKNGNEEQKRLAIFSNFFILFILLGSSVFLVGRISMYFLPFYLVTVPTALSFIRQKEIRFLVLTILIVYLFRQFIDLLGSETFHEKFKVYKTIFEYL